MILKITLCVCFAFLVSGMPQSPYGGSNPSQIPPAAQTGSQSGGQGSYPPASSGQLSSAGQGVQNGSASSAGQTAQSGAASSSSGHGRALDGQGSASGQQGSSSTTTTTGQSSSAVSGTNQSPGALAPSAAGAGQNVSIVKSEFKDDGLGTFRWEFEASDGSRAEQSGHTESPEKGEVIEGSYSYVAPDGQIISVSYKADENGFVPKGSHIPTSPPDPNAASSAAVASPAANQTAGSPPPAIAKS